MFATDNTTNASTLTAKATDNHGATVTSSAAGVTVKTGVAQAYYIHTDHLDTPRTITDTSGNIVWQCYCYTSNTDNFEICRNE